MGTIAGVTLMDSCFAKVTFTIILFSLFSCKQKEKVNTSQSSTDSSEEKITTTFVDTTLNSQKFIYQKSFYPNGTIQQTGFYNSDSVKQGKWTKYYTDGKIESVGNYNNGSKDDTFKFYHENGRLWTEMIYSNDKAMEVVATYDSSGHAKNKGTLKNGNGHVYLYDEKGEKKGMEEYKDGKLVE